MSAKFVKLPALGRALNEIGLEFEALDRITCRNCKRETAACELKTHDGQCMCCHQYRK